MAYAQTDPQWANMTLGPQGSGWTIGAGGCLLTAFCNVLVQYGHDINPPTLNALLVANGLMTWDGDMIAGDVICRIFPDVKYSGYIDMPGDLDYGALSIENQDGVEGILKLDYSPNAGLQTHFCRLRGRDANGYVVMDDSWDGVRCLVKDRYLMDEKKNIYGVTLFFKAPPAPTPTPVDVIPPTSPSSSTSSSESSSESSSTSSSTSPSASVSSSVSPSPSLSPQPPEPWWIRFIKWLINIIGAKK
jgi:hypothetical protein